MATHILKTDHDLFEQTWLELRTFEIRLNDRDYKPGDTLLIKETKATGQEMQVGAPLVYTGREIELLAKHILYGKDTPYGLDDEWVIISISVQKKVE